MLKSDGWSIYEHMDIENDWNPEKKCFGGNLKTLPAICLPIFLQRSQILVRTSGSRYK